MSDKRIRIEECNISEGKYLLALNTQRHEVAGD